MSTSRGKWGLDRDALQRLLAQLDPDPAAAAERYEEIRRRLVYVLELRGSADSEAHAAEALDRVARKIQEGTKVEDVARYACGIARFVLLESERKRNREQAAVQEMGRRSVAAAEPDSDDLRTSCLRKCLAELPEESRVLIEAYYSDWQRVQLEERKALAERLGLSSNSLKMRAFRTRRLLHDCVRGCVDSRKTGNR